MIRPLQFVRLMQIYLVLMRHAFTRTVLGSQPGFLRTLSYLNPFSFIKQDKSRGESVRISLENLGPIFVKFGQLLSTRRDLLPDDIADELAKLQDRVPPFLGSQAKYIIEKAFQKEITELFARFDETPLASASVAQVHAAQLHDGTEVVVKVIRPKIIKVIRHDIAIMYLVARLVERFWSQGKRLHPVAIVSEFEQTILDELDLMREAANASQLRRNFIDSEMLYVPKIDWQLTRHNVMVMERIRGIPIADVTTLKVSDTNMRKLAENGVEIFFTQVFRDSFFHADMHPGNLFVDNTDPQNPKYIGVDFGIMGTLSPEDQHYLAGNILAFFHRDYRQIALLHVESGWVPADTRIDQFESTIRTVCEPVFEKPLKEISFGQLLLRLFQTAERFKMEVQPQLVLLQKTLLTIEGLGRMLYPDLDLWTTAKPYMERWMRRHHGIRHISQQVLQNWQETAESMIKTPRLFFDILREFNYRQRLEKPKLQVETTEIYMPSDKRYFILGSGFALALVAVISFILEKHLNTDFSPWQWIISGTAGLLLLLGWVLPK